jgi:hypothetical protein
MFAAAIESANTGAIASGAKISRAARKPIHDECPPDHF